MTSIIQPYIIIMTFTPASLIDDWLYMMCLAACLMHAGGSMFLIGASLRNFRYVTSTPTVSTTVVIIQLMLGLVLARLQ